MAKLSQPPSLHRRWQADIGDHVISMAWSPDGSTLAAASISGPITLFDTVNGQIRHTLKGHGFGTTCIRWQPGGKILASAGQDGKVRLWDTRKGEELASMAGGSAWVDRLAWSPKGDYLVSSASRKLRLWSDNGTELRTYPDQPNTIADIVWGVRGKRFITGGYGGVRFWTTDQADPIEQLFWAGAVLVLAWSPNGHFLAAGAQDRVVHFWSNRPPQDLETLETMTKVRDLEMSGYPLKVQELAWDPESCFLATGGGNLVMVWDCSGKGPAGSEPIMLEFHVNPLTQLVYQQRGVLLASGCQDGRVALWYPGVTMKALVHTQLEQAVAQLAWSPNDQLLAVGGAAGSVTLFRV